MPAMNIVVCVKQVPDTGSERTLRPADSTVDREGADALINVLDEYAIEEGLRLAEAHGGEVTILSMGPPRASESIRKALSMGADKAVHIVDDGLAEHPQRVVNLAEHPLEPVSRRSDRSLEPVPDQAPVRQVDRRRA